METAETQITLDQLPVGSRLLVRSRVDWRFAAISKRSEGKIVITVCSPSGHTYRLRRDADAEITFNGPIPVLTSPFEDNWHENFGSYDVRW